MRTLIEPVVMCGALLFGALNNIWQWIPGYMASWIAISVVLAVYVSVVLVCWIRWKRRH